MKKLLEYLNDLKGVFVTPGATLGRLMAAREYRAALVAVFLSVVLLSYLALPQAMAKAEQVAGGSGTGISVNFTFVALAAMFVVFVGLSIGSFMIYLFYGAGGVKGEYGHFFALVVNASLIDTVLPNLLVATAAGLLRYFSLAGWFGGVDEKGLTFIALGQVNVFAIWFIVAVAAGVAVFSQMSFKKSLVIGGLYFIFKTVVVVLFKYLFHLLGRNLGM